MGNQILIIIIILEDSLYSLHVDDDVESRKYLEPKTQIIRLVPDYRLHVFSPTSYIIRYTPYTRYKGFLFKIQMSECK